MATAQEYSKVLKRYSYQVSTVPFVKSLRAVFIKHPARDACLCMGELQAPPAPHFVFLITL